VRVIVTGGAGFIGVNLARLYADTATFVAFDNLSIGRQPDASAAGYADVIKGDIRDAEALEDAFSSADCVVHLAAQTGVPKSLVDPWNDLEQNVIGTFRVLEAARNTGVKSVVLASSAAPLGSTPPPASEFVVPRPLSPYGASKLAVEAYASAFHGSFDLATYTLRFSNVYGPWSYLKGSVVALWMRQLLAGEPLQINGDGTQTRDFVHVDDICHAIMLAANQAGPSGLYQLGTGIETSVGTLASMMLDLFDGSADDITYGPSLRADVPRSFCDVSNAKKLLGYDPAVKLQDGLVNTKEWFVDNAEEILGINQD